MRTGGASISWAAELIETTAIGDRWPSHRPTGHTEETAVGDPEAIEQLRSLLEEPEEDQANEAPNRRT